VDASRWTEMVVAAGLEPATFGFVDRRSNPTELRDQTWQERQGSNLRHSVLETDALPTELLSYTPILVRAEGLEPPLLRRMV
jgi:hypothetical protein